MTFDDTNNAWLRLSVLGFLAVSLLAIQDLRTQDRIALREGRVTTLQFEEMVSVRQHGALGDVDQQLDATAAFQAAFDEARTRGVPVYVPPGTAATEGKRQYPVKNLQLQTGDRLHCAPGAIVTSINGAADVIFRATDDVRRVRISGGTWRNCHAIIEHTGATLALSDSVFSDMYIRDVVDGFRFDSLMGCEFSNIRFRDNPVARGFHFTGAGFVNDNTFRHILFLTTVGTAFKFAHNGTTQVRLANRLIGCTFEEIDCGIDVEGAIAGLEVVMCWWEETDEPDQYLPPAGERADVAYTSCFWNGGAYAPMDFSRVMLRGDSAAVIRGGTLRETERESPGVWTFLDVGSTAARPSIIDGLVMVQGNGTLYRRSQGSTQPVVVR